MIALQYHEVKVIVTWNATSAIISDAAATLYADYIYLDTDERRRFAQVSHEYLIEQVQSQEWATTSQTLNFNHPVKELIWLNTLTAAGDSEGRETIATLDPATTWQLRLNGHDRFAARDVTYFTRVQVLQYHSGPGGMAITGTANGMMNDSIAVYSFALKPEEHQPSGTCNFSRIDSAQLISNATPVVPFTVFAVNYNVLRIMSGMGGLAYSN